MKLPLKDAAPLLGIHRATLYRYVVDRGCPHSELGGNWYFDIEEVKKWRVERGLTGEIGPVRWEDKLAQTTEAPADFKEQLAVARLRKENALAEKHELSASLTRGEYVERAQVEKERLDRINAVKAKLLALPGKVSTRLANRNSEEIYIELRREVHDLLLDFAGGQLDLDENTTQTPRLVGSGVKPVVALRA